MLSDGTGKGQQYFINKLSQCTFWRSVLSDPKEIYVPGNGEWSQCTFWRSVLSDERIEEVYPDLVGEGLNAPSGAQRFPTLAIWESVTTRPFRLNAPFGAQCFPTERPLASPLGSSCVSMHLLVLSAFRLRLQKTAPQRRLSERNRRRPGKHHIESACTCPIKPHNREKPPQTTPAPPMPPTHQYATDFQRTQAKKPTPHDYAKVNFVLLGVQNPLLQSDDYFASGRTDTGLH